MRQTLRTATASYLAARDGEVAPATLSFISGCMAPILAYMGNGPVTTERVIAYRRQRKATPATINQEIGVLCRVLAHAGLPVPAVRPLRSAPAPLVAMTVEQKRKLFDTAAERPAWSNAYLAATIAACTTMRSCEIKSLQWQHVDLAGRVILVPRSKSEAGYRAIPINDTLLAAFLPLSRAPGEYVVQSPSGGPCRSWRTAWANLTAAAGLPGLHFHALRHQAITELCEAGVPEETVRSIAGHVSRRMMERYSHIRVAAKAAAVGVLGA